MLTETSIKWPIIQIIFLSRNIGNKIDCAFRWYVYIIYIQPVSLHQLDRACMRVLDAREAIFCYFMLFPWNQVPPVENDVREPTNLFRKTSVMILSLFSETSCSNVKHLTGHKKIILVAHHKRNKFNWNSFEWILNFSPQFAIYT